MGHAHRLLIIPPAGQQLVPLACDCPPRRPDSKPFLRPRWCTWKICPGCDGMILPPKLGDPS